MPPRIQPDLWGALRQCPWFIRIGYPLFSGRSKGRTSNRHPPGAPLLYVRRGGGPTYPPSRFIGEGGEIFILKMGESVKIADMARELIKLTGFLTLTEILKFVTPAAPVKKIYES